LVDSGTILLRNFALNHIHRSSLKLFPDDFLALPLGALLVVRLARLLARALATHSLALLCSDGISLGLRGLRCDYRSTVDIVERVIENFKVHAILVCRLFQFNLEMLVLRLISCHESIDSLE